MKNIFTAIGLTLLLFSCTSEEPADKNSAEVPKIKQYNISILLDLSDRISEKLHPEQGERDVKITNSIVQIFKSKMEKDGAYGSKSKIRILFDPAPSDPRINGIAEKLSVDLSKFDNKKKKEIHDGITNDFENGMSEIYKLAINAKDFPGSDIWGFFKHNVNDLCIDRDPQYRNILIILTDGYLYDAKAMYKDKKQTSYILSTFLRAEGFTEKNWKDKFANEGYGLMNTGQTFDGNLEVMVLGINPDAKNKYDEDIIRAYLGKWFNEMKVKSPVFYNTDLPVSTQKKIEDFFKSN